VLGIEALDLGDSVSDLAPLNSEPLGQLATQMSLIDIARRFELVVDARVVEAGPSAIGSLGRVGD
jgi:hypothetical protein